MSTKKSIQDISSILVERSGFDKSEANRFASMIFQIIQEHLDTEGIVKIKGLGTFKMVDVEPRESVSVQTGERVVIGGHSKVTFTPDATMKELVNKPFSQFETVVLNDGVEFDGDIPDNEEEIAPVEVESQATELLNTKETEPVVEKELSIGEEEEEEVSVNEEEASVSKEEESATEEDIHIEEDEPRHTWIQWLFAILGICALMAIAALGGYYYGTSYLATPIPTIADTIVVHDTIRIAPEPIIEAQKDTIQVLQDTKPVEQLQDTKSVEPTKIVPAVPPAKQEDKYAAKDPRVRLGAYRIVGLDKEVTVLAGQTFYSICRAHLGPDMECYVEVFNGLPQNPVIKAGQVIKIPKLQLKKRKK